MKAAFFNCFICFSFANHVVEIFRDQCKRACCQCFAKDLNNLDCHERITKACENNFPSEIVCKSEFSDERKKYEDEECPQCAHCKYCDIHNEEPIFYDYENPGDDYYYYYHGKESVPNFQFRGEFMKICEDWNEPPITKTSLDSITKTSTREENCSKFCNQRFLQNKFHEIALIWADLAVQEKALRKGKAKRKTTSLRKVIDHRERNFKCRKGNPIPAKIFNVKCCENIANKAADEEETINLLCNSIGRKNHEKA
ncbi:Oidioi.mRNA.OKI2018_I69.chr2.g4221.t1.cds [Oikopleura dioica]|uniref:Oidioi.mRNA.OKI2018_I69.chr2.g4221.t1.cds n=1 Tax=Oikopleura dioica TaxID=34765 RepID=A0ABN7T260_OIKDI|nr:Oidioi.mRNA.OKI2018_I69.chr2.g4221.t1.cds [Oikopleura dioica]